MCCRPSDSARGLVPEQSRPDRRGIPAAAFGRSVAAAGGAVAGVLLAVPFGLLLFIVLLLRVGIPLILKIIHELTSGMSTFDAIVVGIPLGVILVIVAICVVIVLVAPIFILLPLVTTAAVLRYTNAGMILRTLWLMLGMTFLLVAAIMPMLSLFHLHAYWWTWVAIVAGGAFVGRLIVELWKPDLANKATASAVVQRRWIRLALAWFILALLAVVGSIILFVYKIHL